MSPAATLEALLLLGCHCLQPHVLPFAPERFAGAASSPADTTTTVLRGARVLTMEDQRARAGWSVVVRGDRIVELGPEEDLAVPDGATVIDAAGGYLLPGLFDAHAHLDPEVGGRPDFGEAPLYLAFGVTSVVSMKGDPEYLEVRERIRRGEFLAPNLYAAGPFVDEPFITTPTEAAAAVEEQRAAGYDLVKLHEVYEFDDPYHFLGGVTYLTSHGLDQATLNGLARAAREAGIPALGHIPPRLGLEGMLEAGLSLAHASILLGAYFWPSTTTEFETHARWLRWGVWLLMVAIAVLLAETAWSVVRRRRPVTSWLAAIGAGILVGVVVFAREDLSSYEWLGDAGRVFAWTAAGVVVGAIALALAIDAIWTLRGRRPWMRRAQAVVGAAGALAVASTVLSYWVPLLNRSTPDGLHDLGRKMADAGLWVQTTLSVEDTLVLREIPELDLLDPRKARLNRVWAERWSPERIDLVRRGLPFFEDVVGALHEAGVPLMLGTDAMGFPMIVPGVSVHDEMRLLANAGLSPYEVLRTATVNPARFLGVEDEVGMIGVGKRADLVLVEGDPLANLAVLRSPVGVMIRGRWLDRAELQAGLDRLREVPLPLSEQLAAAIEAEGIEVAAARFRERLDTNPDPTLGPGELNTLGYDYLGKEQVGIAVRVFELNVEAFPEAWNPWDSLGEAYLEAGERERAIASYRRSLELNPDNDNARMVLRELGEEEGR